MAACDRAKVRITKDGNKVSAKDESATSYGISIIREIFQPYEECIEFFIKQKLSGRGRPEAAFSYLAACDVRETAYIAAKAIIDSISRLEKQTSLAMRISGHLEDHMRFASFEITHPKYYKAVIEDLAKRRVGDYRTKRKTLVACHNRAIANDNKEGIETAEWIKWPTHDRVAIGVNLIDMLILSGSEYQNGESGVNNCYQNANRLEGTGFIERVQNVGAGKSQTYVVGTAKAAEWIKANMAVCATLHPEYLPTLIPPKDWSTPYDGGYYLPELRRRKPLVKSGVAHRKVLENAYMPDVYDAINLAQQTPWAINEFVMAVIQDEWKAPKGIKMPGSEPIAAPPNPLGELEQGTMTRKAFKSYRKRIAANLTPDEKADFAQWKRDEQECQRKEQERISKIINLSGAIRVAKMLQDFEEFYYVHTLDYRGRLYPCGTGLNPQGADMSKALLRFARGNKLGKDGYWHLCIHAAGVYGVDKVSLQDRVKWIHENKGAIFKTGLDPQETRDFWGAADKPYLFLAACQELAEIWCSYSIDVNNCLQTDVQDMAMNYVSHLPCAQDGSCNGIQHFSAMLGDSVGAQAVNMTDSPDVEDIYQQTADKVTADLRESLHTGIVRNGNTLESASQEQLWLIDRLLSVVTVTRKTTKKSTMVIPYGGTKRSCLTSVKDYIFERIEETWSNGPVFDNKQAYAAALLLHHYVWHALDTVVVAARKAMKFLRNLVKVNNREDCALHWTTPTGFIARQEIKDTRSKEVETRLCGRMRIMYIEETDNLNKYKMASSFPPNFVHSMDASHLMLTVNAAADIGIADFALVHDSYGVPAGSCESFHAIIREQFYQIYKNNVLLGLKQQQIAQFPENTKQYPPDSDVEPGNYNINDVKQALYFFR